VLASRAPLQYFNIKSVIALCYENKEAKHHAGVLAEDKAFITSKTMNLLINPECV